VTGAERAAAALMVSCGFCWAVPGTACGQDGLHLARYVRGYRRGLISQEELAVVCNPLEHVSAGQIVVAPELRSSVLWADRGGSAGHAGGGVRNGPGRTAAGPR
jgi:hypothetical protein